jgi:hypothetical protein
MTPPKPSNPDRLCPFLPEWEVYIGCIFVYIVGPGPDAMRRCSERSLTPGTKDELKIARKTVKLLNKTERENIDAGPAEILSALIKCGYKEELL